MPCEVVRGCLVDCLILWLESTRAFFYFYVCLVGFLFVCCRGLVLCLFVVVVVVLGYLLLLLAGGGWYMVCFWFDW